MKIGDYIFTSWRKPGDPDYVRGLGQVLFVDENSVVTFRLISSTPPNKHFPSSGSLCFASLGNTTPVDAITLLTLLATEDDGESK